jgi:hypothetical protein
MIFDDNEDQQELLSKCMANTEIKAEYADTDKRLAFCMAQSKKGRKTSVLAEVCDHLLAKNCSWDDTWDEFTWEIEAAIIYDENNKALSSEYQGKKVTLNKPFRTPDGPKKFSVYVNNDRGNVVKVNFGDPNMTIKKNIPERRKSFRARHKCDQKKDKTTPGYWSCKMW